MESKPKEMVQKEEEFKQWQLDNKDKPEKEVEEDNIQDFDDFVDKQEDKPNDKSIKIETDKFTAEIEEEY